MSKITVDRRLWVTASGDTLVEEGDPDAAFLWAGEGREVDEDEAERVGYKPKGKPGRPKGSKNRPKPDS